MPTDPAQAGPVVKRRRWLNPMVFLGVVGVGAACLALVALAFVGVALLDADRDAGRDVGREADQEPDSASIVYPDEWDPVVSPYVDFVAAERGLEFLHPVDVQFLDIETSLSEAQEEYQESFDDVTLAYFADWDIVNSILGLTESGTDSLQAQNDVRSAGAAAYYDSAADVLVLPLGGSGIALQLSIVHELTHVLQDQHGLFDGVVYTEDQGTMNRILTEGDASLVEDAWYLGLSGEELAQLEQEWGDEVYEEPEGYSALDFYVPYILGPPAVALIRETVGADGLSEAEAEVLFTTEMLVDPLSSSPTPVVAQERSPRTPPSGSEQGIEGSLGPLLLYLSLAPEIGAPDTFDLLRGYDTDSFVLWTKGNVACIELSVWFDTFPDAREFSKLVPDQFQELTVTTAGVPKAPRVEARLCDDRPVGNPQNQQLDLLRIPATNLALLVDLQREGIAQGRAECAALAVAHSLDLSAGERIQRDIRGSEPIPSDDRTYDELLGEARLEAKDARCQPEEMGE